jgi:diguanylate cyclase (GGDEF)-like protein/putative nucleotidyltransferase with HDIG domain
MLNLAPPRADEGGRSTSAPASPMTPPLSRFRPSWSALRSAAVERMSEDDVRWRALGALFAAGGLLALVIVVLPTEPGTHRWAIAALAGAALVHAAVMIAVPRLLPAGDLSVSLALGAGTLLITAAVYFARVPSTPLALLYLWVAFDGFFFLSRASAVRHLLFVGLCYGFVLASLPASDSIAVGRWVMTMGTVAVVGALADVLRERSERLIRRLGEVASTDPLTGLWNRRGFERLMATEFARASRSGEHVSLLIGDLDHFKTINDLFGHGTGDDALRRFSSLVQRLIRQSDSAARIGGEEFAIILPATDSHDAFVLAERLRRQVRTDLVQEGRLTSISFGVATAPAHGATPDQLLHNADRALYVAKHLGRDRSVIYNAEVDASLDNREHQPAAPEQLSAVLVLAETIDLRDSGTAAHSQTVGRYAEATARNLGLSPAQVERVRLAGILHDIGKLGVPDNILQKPAALSAAEWAEMRKHPELGARILAGANLDDISGWVLAHHERPDGSGYPAGLGDDEIALEAKILAVADSFEAMTSDRVYRPAMPVADAIEELRRHGGSQFDAAVVEALVATLGAPHAESVLTA